MVMPQKKLRPPLVSGVKYNVTKETNSSERKYNLEYFHSTLYISEGHALYPADIAMSYFTGSNVYIKNIHFYHTIHRWRLNQWFPTLLACYPKKQHRGDISPPLLTWFHLTFVFMCSYVHVLVSQPMFNQQYSHNNLCKK